MKPGPETSTGLMADRSRTLGLASGDIDLRVGGCGQFLTELQVQVSQNLLVGKVGPS